LQQTKVVGGINCPPRSAQPVEGAVKIEVQVARVADRAKGAQALVIGAADDEMPAGHDAVAVQVPRGLADRAAEDDLQQAMHTILQRAGERESRALVTPALGVWWDRARNDVAAAIIVRALLEDAPRLAPRLWRATICVPISKQACGFAMAQQLHDPGDQLIGGGTCQPHVPPPDQRRPVRLE
jgi:hypothetical protein